MPRSILAWARRLASRPLAAKIYSRCGTLFPEIDVLQRLVGLDSPELDDGGLEIVAFLARDAQLVALDRHLDLELAVLDLAHQALGELLVDALLEQHGLANRVARRLLGRLELERGGVDLAPRQMRLQELVHLLQLEVVVGEHRHGALLALDRAVAALEVEARRDLAAHPGERVVDLGEVELGDDVETRHGAAP